ncbi:DUF1127 domain-containing protein [Rubellimicrobium arenae]|uniref:DUF1127 domain-containing protein n=1 Tax=Rubellimicrobium arenae TaxID=2817372 RepID=UPI001B30D52E|nr:DUF1127 domain-containing protein [Rubellimicrobium arenae]
MAYATFGPRASERLSVLQHLAGLRLSLSDHLARRRAYRATLEELRALSDRDLADLDLHRSLIPEIARMAADWA